MKHKIQKVISILLVTILLLPSAVFAKEPRDITIGETIFYAEKACMLPTQTATEGI